MRTLRTVALGLAIAAVLMTKCLPQAIQFLFNADGFTFGLALRALRPEMADLGGLQLLLGTIVIMFFLAAGLLIASFVMPLVDETVSSLAALWQALLDLTVAAAERLRRAPGN